MPTVLVVDDALFMRVAISSMFEEWGYSVVAQAANGREAIKLYKEHKPDIVTMDLTMPVMSGIDAVKGIITDDPQAKIIMVTALGQKRYVVEAIESGARDFVTKPFQPMKLKEIVEHVLEQQ